jgi:FkbH-like protein
LHDRGVLLAINSKNNTSDVEEVFQSHPDMVLRADHFVSMQVNWRAKPENMIEIARELNIGLDSLVFFDDSAAERALMRRALPEVLTIEVPVDAVYYVDALRESAAFEQLAYTHDDRRRTELYLDQRARATLLRTVASLDDFLANLNMRASVSMANAFTLPRIANLVQKTNQFNLTTRRRTPGELATLAADPEWGVLALHVSDRFGDQGLVGVAIAHLTRRQVDLDTFLLSCRVIGRRVETALLRAVVDWALAKGASHLHAEYIPSAKNAPARDFLLGHGMTELWRDGDHHRCRLELESAPFTWPSCIESASDATWMQPA